MPNGSFTQEDPIGIAGGLSLYGYAGGDPVTFTDPFGLCPMCYLAFEVGATLFDVGDLALTGVNYLRGRASGRDLSVTAGGALLGTVVFGGGLGRAGRSALQSPDAMSSAARAHDRAGYTRAGRALTKHASGQRGGSAFPRLAGGVDQVNATAHGIVDDILTNPSSDFRQISRGKWRGGVEVFDPSGRGLRYDADGGFVGFIQR
jgi:uncharacterized protein RhaS with RHS repeats